MTISASDVMKLRALTGAGMMDCKSALEEAGGDMEKAADLLRKKGIVKAAKRADKVAAEGKVSGFVNDAESAGSLVEVNCETDFVAKSDNFLIFCQSVAEVIVKDNPADVSALGKCAYDGKTVDETVQELTLKIGEKIHVRRFARFEAASGNHVYTYLHGARIGVLVEIQGGDKETATDIAMHIAASNPKYLNSSEVDTAEVEREKEIYVVQLKGKPENIIENILKGKLAKFYSEICLLDQPFIKDEALTVEKFAASKNAKVVRFVRFELGEGIEKEHKDFAAEVAEQLK